MEVIDFVPDAPAALRRVRLSLPRGIGTRSSTNTSSGEVGIDDALVKLSSQEEIIDMNNGCICCTGERSVVVLFEPRPVSDASFHSCTASAYCFRHSP